MTSPAAPTSHSGISVCMPAYNEAANLAAAVDDVIAVMAPRFQRVEIVIVNDGSRDETRSMLDALCRQHTSLRAVHHPKNLGYGAAARTALEAATQDFLLLTDADRQFGLSDVDPLLEWIETHDLVVGYRAPRRDPWPRVWAGHAWTSLTNVVCGYLARDVNCAFKLVRRPSFRQVAPQLRCRGATFSAEWLAWSRRTGQRVKEVPVRHYPRRAGTSTGMRGTVMARGLWELAALRLRLARYPPPGRLG